MANNLKMSDQEFNKALTVLQAQCAELESILGEYGSVMNEVGLKGLDTKLIRTGIQNQTSTLESLRNDLSQQRETLASSINSFVHDIDAIDRY